MYWPTGSASRISISSTSTADQAFHNPTQPSPSHSNQQTQPGELLGITASSPSNLAPNGLFATWTSDELTVWSSKPKAVLTKLRRPIKTLESLGFNRDVKWKTGSKPVLVILVRISFLENQVIDSRRTDEWLLIFLGCVFVIRLLDRIYWYMSSWTLRCLQRRFITYQINS